MNPQEARERAEQEVADQAEEERVAREDKIWLEEFEARMQGLAPYRVIRPYERPYLFADGRSQRRAEEEERFYGPIDDYAAFLDQAPPYEQLIQ